MAYTASTQLPALAFFQWSLPDSPTPRLASPIDADDTTLTFTSAPTDKDGSVITDGFLMNCTNESGFTELMYVPPAGMSGDGLTATGVVRGVRITGTDYTTGDSSFAAIHEGDSAVGCAVNAVYEAIVAGIFTGTIATSGTSLRIGDETDVNVTIVAALAADKGFLRKNATTGKAQYSNDGSAWVDIDSVSASNLVEVSAADTTPGYLNTKITVDADTMTKAITGGGGDERLNLTAVGGLADIVDDVTITAAELNQLDGISANVTDTNLNTLTAGADSDASTLHKHSSETTDYMLYETITANDAVCLKPIECEYFAQLTDATIALGDAAARRKYAIKIVPSRVPNFTTMNIRAREAVNASTNGNIDVTIETDNAGEPSGTPVTNGTANQITQATIRTWNVIYGSRTITWASAPEMVAGTTYWIVISIDFTDVANYVELSVNSSHDEDFLTFTRLTGTSAPAWSGSATNATPFFWTVSEERSLGMALCEADADFGGRTWDFVGFLETSGVQGDTQGVYDVKVPSAAAMTFVAGKDYYVSPTAGEVTTTPPNGVFGNDFRYKIGRATSASELIINPGSKVMTNGLQGTKVTATATVLVPTWFAPIRAEFTAQGGAASGDNVVSNGGTSTGYWDITGPTLGCIYHRSDGGVNMGNTFSASVCMWGKDVAGAHGFSGTATGSNGGMSIALAESGTGQMNYFWKIEG